MKQLKNCSKTRSHLEKRFSNFGFHHISGCELRWRDCENPFTQKFQYASCKIRVSTVYVCAGFLRKLFVTVHLGHNSLKITDLELT